MRQIVTLTRSDAPNAFVQGVLCALLLLVALPVWSQSEFCLEGTVWDATLGGCIPEESCAVEGDFNGDGLVGSADLLAFLTLYGNQYLDSDGDGLCDTLDDCDGVVDACGVCNGPGPIYDCGCEDILAGNCDCDGNQLDALGICGGGCIADEDGDGICDDEDDCVGAFDECGICNGPGAIYDCGCEECGTGFVECGDAVGYQGYDYATVLIGGQCWFAENLRSELYGNGEAIPSGLSDSDWGSTGEGAIATYGEGNSTCTTFSPLGDACDEAWSLEEFGVLYNWHAVADTRALCPSGWHVPSNDDWTELTDGLGGSLVAGQALKSDSGWYNGGNGSNSSGFNGLPGGIRMTNGPFFNAGDFGYWWSSTPSGSQAWFRFLNSSNNLIEPYSDQPRFGFSVRCILDTEACSVDEDGDGICDDVDECVGALDECGICNGPGAIYDCGCEECPLQDDCGSPVSYQGYDYATVQIGTQCWFAENLRNDVYLNGDDIPGSLSPSEWENTSQGATTVYGENGIECEAYNGSACDDSWSLEEYGRLYNWYAVNDNRKLCPSGWHVPTDGEWTLLVDNLGGEDSAMLALKTTSGWAEDGNGTNSSGFGALPGGVRDDDVDTYFHNAGYSGVWWTSSGFEWYCGGVWGMGPDEVANECYSPEFGLSVRCLMDNDECASDEDQDGICDEVDDCVGIEDVCGVCNGNGYPEGGCDCEGNMPDECGVCDGPGAIYDCGCEDCPTLEGCGNPVSYQGYNYATVQIGGRCWFAENLRNQSYRNGDNILTTGPAGGEWLSMTQGATCVYGEGTVECESWAQGGDACNEAWSLSEYGRLYNGHAVQDARQLCPSGWYVPSDDDWTELTDVLGGQAVAGEKMRSTYGWWFDEGGTNESGFSGLPGGSRGFGAHFWNAGGDGYWWSSTLNGEDAWYRRLESAENQAFRGYADLTDGHSVRCIRDESLCSMDEDNDGICDDLDDCVGDYDVCGNCNGPGAIYDCGCTECVLFEGCGSPITYQGHTYATVQIGDQCWFSENLRSEQYANGQPIDSELNASDWATTNSGAFAVYGEGAAACETNSPDGNACDEAWSAIAYGHLYNWHAVSDERGLCPTGWHVPSDQEWTTLTNQFSGDAFAGEDLKMTYGWELNGNGTNASGFAGLPGGFREVNGVFELAGSLGCWWTSTPTGNNAWNRDLDAINSFVLSFDANLQSGFSVRCVLDEN